MKLLNFLFYERKILFLRNQKKIRLFKNHIIQYYIYIYMIIVINIINLKHENCFLFLIFYFNISCYFIKIYNIKKYITKLSLVVINKNNYTI